jgi:hypothetical protein
MAGPTSLPPKFFPEAIASRSARRSRKLSGSTSTFCSNPALIIRQRVARLTPKNFADADMPMSKGPWCTGICSGMRPSRIPSITPNCSGEASSNFFNRWSVFMVSPHSFPADFDRSCPFREDRHRDDGCSLNHEGETSIQKTGISERAELECCTKHPHAYAFSCACRKFLILWLTRFCDNPPPSSTAVSCSRLKPYEPARRRSKRRQFGAQERARD